MVSKATGMSKIINRAALLCPFLEKVVCQDGYGNSNPKSKLKFGVGWLQIISLELEHHFLL